MEKPDFTQDIPRTLAMQSHAGISHSPEKRGEAELQQYVAQMEADYAELRALAEERGEMELFADLFPKYHEAYKRANIATLHALSQCLSPMITGPARFPVERNNKKYETHRKRSEEEQATRKKWLDRFHKAVSNDPGPIHIGDADALPRLEERLAEAEARQDQMKAANAVLRKLNKASDEERKAALITLGFDEKTADKVAQEGGFQTFTLSNNAARIRTTKGNIARKKRIQAQPVVTLEAEAFRIEDNPADNRVRFFFPGKPEAEVRKLLKSHGFRWAPSLGCWQAYRNDRAREGVQKMREQHAAA